MYSSVNYLLMCASVLVIGGLVTGVVFLFLRELGMKRREKQQHRLDVLSRRRKGFSGQSGVPSRVGSGLSNNITTGYINHIHDADEGVETGGGGGGGWGGTEAGGAGVRDDRDEDNDEEVVRIKPLAFGGLVTSRALDLTH